MTIVGIDCATLASKTGLAFTEYVDGRLEVNACMIADSRIPVAEQVVRWLKPTTSALLALDSPLGWPALLGTTLADHKARAAIYARSNELFRRRTDEVVKTTLGKSPLEVGADRIARTAISALSLLADVGVLIGKNIALAWDARFDTGIRAIEVCPAGTLRAYQQIGIVSKSGDVDQDKRSLVAKMRKNGRLRLGERNVKLVNNERNCSAPGGKVPDKC
jgi:hypothetical protein